MSEHKKSRSSRSSSRRSSSRSSSRSSLKGAGADKSKTIGQRLLEMMLGVLVGGTLLFGLIWFFFIRETPELVQRRENIENSVITGTVDPIADFETIRDTGTVGDMKTLLLSLNEWPRDGNTAVMIDYQKKRIEIADKMLSQKGITELQRELAGAGKLDAFGAWYGLDYEKQLGDPLIAERFQAACKEFENDPDMELRREAILGKAKTLVFEYCRGNWNGTFAHVESTVLTLPKEFPEDAYVLSNINLLMSTLQQKKEKESIELYRKLSVAYQGSTNPQIANLQSRLADVVLLYESGISQLLSGNWNTPVTKAELLNELAKLANHPNAGATVVKQIGFAVNGFEKISDYEYAKKTCEVLKNSPVKRTPEITKLASDIANDGLQRMKALNQPWSFKGVDVNGREIDVSKFKDKVVVILYWSPRNSRLAASQFSLLAQLDSLVASSGVRFVTVQIEDLPGMEVKADPNWTNILSTESNQSNYTRQFPVNRVPYFTIIDRDGILKEMHVPYEELKTKIDFYSRVER